MFSLNTDSGNPDQRAKNTALWSGHALLARATRTCNDACHTMSIYSMQPNINACLRKMTWNEIHVFMLTTNGADPEQRASMSSQFKVCSISLFNIFEVYDHTLKYFSAHLHIYVYTCTYTEVFSIYTFIHGKY